MEGVNFRFQQNCTHQFRRAFGESCFFQIGATNCFNYTTQIIHNLLLSRKSSVNFFSFHLHLLLVTCRFCRRFSQARNIQTSARAPRHSNTGDAYFETVPCTHPAAVLHTLARVRKDSGQLDCGTRFFMCGILPNTAGLTSPFSAAIISNRFWKRAHSHSKNLYIRSLPACMHRTTHNPIMGLASHTELSLILG